MTQRLRDVLGGLPFGGGQIQRGGHLLAAVMSGRANLCVPVTGRVELDAGRTGNPLSSLSAQPAPRCVVVPRAGCSRRTQRRLILLRAVNSLSSRLRRAWGTTPAISGMQPLAARSPYRCRPAVGDGVSAVLAAGFP